MKPDSTAERVALWRALHVELDSPPVFEDVVGLKLIAPDDRWRRRPDMDPQFTRLFRASIVARARFIDDLAIEQYQRGVNQYVILGAGLDTFAQRHPNLLPRLHIFEVDRPEPQAWKHQRLIDLGFGVPPELRFVPVDFESGKSWWNEMIAHGFDATQPAVVASTGVSLYLTKEAISATLRQIAALASGSTFAMTYLLPMEMADPEERHGREIAERGARASGTPFISFFRPEEMRTLALDAGFKDAKCVSAAMLAERYFTGRADGLRPAKSEELLIATV